MRSTPLLLVAFGLSSSALAVLAQSAEKPPQRTSAHRGATARGATAASHAAQASSSPAVTRESLESLGVQLDSAVDSVSLPRVAGLLARDAARGYRLPGYGVVFVLTPRSLPGTGHNFLVHVSPHGGPARPQRVQAAGEPGPTEVETLERHVVILQNETEQARQAAEQDMERIVHDLRVRLLTSDAPPSEATEPAASPSTGRETAAAPPGRAPGAEREATAPAEGHASAAPAEADDAQPPGETPLPPPPPWKFWFQTGGTRDGRSPQAMIADVRAALVEALQGHAAQVAGLRPEEFVTVAVDFELPDPFAARPRPERTLVVRARAADVAARARAAIDAEEFRRRVEVLEY